MIDVPYFIQWDIQGGCYALLRNSMTYLMGIRLRRHCQGCLDVLEAKYQKMKKFIG
jgi:hypothetical protein